MGWVGPGRGSGRGSRWARGSVGPARRGSGTPSRRGPPMKSHGDDDGDLLHGSDRDRDRDLDLDDGGGLGLPLISSSSSSEQ